MKHRHPSTSPAKANQSTRLSANDDPSVLEIEKMENADTYRTYASRRMIATARAEENQYTDLESLNAVQLNYMRNDLEKQLARAERSNCPNAEAVAWNLTRKLFKINCYLEDFTHNASDVRGLYNQWES